MPVSSIVANLIVGVFVFVGGIVIIRFRKPLHAFVLQSQKAMLGERAAQLSAGRQKPWVLGVVGAFACGMGVAMVTGAIVAIVQVDGHPLAPTGVGSNAPAASNPDFATLAPFVIVGSLALVIGCFLIRFRVRIYDFLDRRIRAARHLSEVNEFARQQRPAWIGLLGVLLAIGGIAVIVVGVVQVQLASGG
ncbi:hypothetical protein [Microbacterium saperdae]|uniref:Uncharacterized protein n=1 Tax=Microbacterium saperdae TaxID=69368 RepID=A0A543BQ20_9MICO|nr:hypothetical protein [Microbacterium saperdae]TQL86912.1 hypothetical protein FB560_2577 [Microbacterium saperdae]GGM44376.1 hypothetical protein GCM10010489_14380 [Microbacterium saperdae]